MEPQHVPDIVTLKHRMEHSLLLFLRALHTLLKLTQTARQLEQMETRDWLPQYL